MFSHGAASQAAARTAGDQRQVILGGPAHQRLDIGGGFGEGHRRRFAGVQSSIQGINQARGGIIPNLTRLKARFKGHKLRITAGLAARQPAQPALTGTRTGNQGLDRAAKPQIWSLTIGDAIREFERFGNMQHARGQTGSLQASPELHVTAGIAADDQGGIGGGNIGHFVVQHGIGNIRQDDVIDTSAAAAAIGLTQFHQFQAGDGAQEGARLLDHALTVPQMTGF